MSLVVPAVSDALFEYANETGRPPGRLLRAAARVLPGVASVRAQFEPYAAAWQEANRAALRGTGRRWVVLGDSMSLGIGASGPFEGWVGQLSRRLDPGLDPGLDVLNLAASGARTPDLLDQQLPAWRAAGPAPAGELVTVLIGSNDLLNRAARDALPEAFGRLLAALPDGAVVATLPQPRRAAQAVNARIEADSARLRVVDLRVSGPQSWRGRLAADHFHPNDLGYAGLADAFEDAVRAAAAG